MTLGMTVDAAYLTPRIGDGENKLNSNYPIIT